MHNGPFDISSYPSLTLLAQNQICTIQAVKMRIARISKSKIEPGFDVIEQPAKRRKVVRKPDNPKSAV